MNFQYQKVVWECIQAQTDYTMIKKKKTKLILLHK